MRLSKSNNLSGATFPIDYNITAGGVLSGTPEDLVNSDFSFFPTISGAIVRINVSATSSEFNSDYFCLHGVRFNAGASDVIRATIFSNGVQIGTELIKSGVTLFYTREATNSDWYVEFTPEGGIPSIVVTISYIRSGLYSDWPRSGIRGGEYMPFFGNNRITRATSNQLAQPITRTITKVAKMVTIQCPNPPIDYIENDLQEIFDAYNEDGVISVQMYDDRVTRSFAGFDLVDSVKVNGDSGELLSSLSLKMKATL